MPTANKAISRPAGPQQLTLPPPHSTGQMEMLHWGGNGVVFAGRRWGKTEILVQKLLVQAIQQPDSLVWWIGVSWRSASMLKAWRLMTKYARQYIKLLGYKPDNFIHRGSYEIVLPNESQIWFRTAERPESLAGEGVHGAVVDEFTLMQEHVWTEYLAPTLLDYGGWVFFAGVPKGKNWGAELWRSAHGWSGWKAWRFTTWDNPTLKRADIDLMTARLPQRIVDQEFRALIVDDAGAVFRNIVQCATALAQDAATAGHAYCMGLDWGRSNDATVVAIVDLAEKALVYLDRIVDHNYELQLGRVRAAYNRFKPSLVYGEANAMGGPLVEKLQSDRIPVMPFVTNNASKRAIIEGLAFAFEQREIRILADDDLITELEVYEEQRTQRGQITYNAPGSYHDDCVIALALAWQPAAASVGLDTYSPWDGGGEIPSEIVRINPASVHSDTPEHRKWSKTHECDECYREYISKGELPMGTLLG